MKFYRIEQPKHLHDFLNEASKLSVTELLKYRGVDGTYDRAAVLINKLSNGGTLKLVNQPATIQLDPEANAELIKQLSTHDKDTITQALGKGTVLPVIMDTDGVGHKITEFEKTIEFGGGTSKVDAKQTKIQEIGQAVVLGLMADLGRVPTMEDITNPNILSKGLSHVVPDCTSFIPDIIQKINQDAKQTWGYTFIASARSLHAHLKGMDGKVFHRDGPLMTKITNTYTMLSKKEKPKPFSQKDKWNPADIWAADPDVSIPDDFESLAEFNAWLLEQFSADKLYGISLKAVEKNASGMAKFEVFNTNPVETQIKAVVTDLMVVGGNNLINLFNSKSTNIKYKTESYTIPLSLYVTVYEAERNQVENRTAKGGEDMRSEIMGASARGGNLSFSQINAILYKLTNEAITSRIELLSRLEQKDGVRGMINDIIDMAEKIRGSYVTSDERKKMFTQANAEGTEDRFVSKYQSIQLLYILNQHRGSGDKKINAFLNQILTLAGAKAALSSVYVKVS